MAIVRTPFQAWLLQRVLQEEKVEAFDLIYLTQNDSGEDRHYYSVLERLADCARYVFVATHGPDIWSHIRFKLFLWQWFKDRHYQHVFLASIEAYVPSGIAAAQASAKLITFDDGSANVFQHSAYFRNDRTVRERVYARLLGAQGLHQLKARISKHYTVFPHLENIVEAKRCSYLAQSFAGCAGVEDQCDSKTYFIGGPFEEILSLVQIARLQKYLQSQRIDYYVKHPREREPFALGVPLLDKNGLIAEDAIIRHAEGADIQIFGSFSTVLLNLCGTVRMTRMVVLWDQKNAAEIIEFGEKLGCEVAVI